MPLNPPEKPNPLLVPNEPDWAQLPVFHQDGTPGNLADARTHHRRELERMLAQTEPPQTDEDTAQSEAIEWVPIEIDKSLAARMKAWLKGRTDDSATE